MGSTDAATATFIDRWREVAGSERANYQLFVADLCELLDVPPPEPADADARGNAYVFERRVTFAHGDGSSSHGFIDCYRRGAFVLEAKKVKLGLHARGFDDALLRARAQAERYARALPAAEGRRSCWSPMSATSSSSTTNSRAPAPRTRRSSTRAAIASRSTTCLTETVRQRLRTLWLDPMALDPARASAKVTGEVALQLAHGARSLEAAGHAPQKVAAS